MKHKVLFIAKLFKLITIVLLILCILFATPVLLILVVGIPITHNLSGHLDYGIILDGLTIAAWITWIRFSYLVLTEIVQRLHYKSFINQEEPRRSMRAVAGWLVAVAMTAATLVHKSSTTYYKSPAMVELVNDTSTSSYLSDSFTFYTVQPGDSLWSIANAIWGDPSLWNIIAEANLGNEMTAGRYFDNPAVLFPGWILKIPQIPFTSFKTAATAGEQGGAGQGGAGQQAGGQGGGEQGVGSRTSEYSAGNSSHEAIPGDASPAGYFTSSNAQSSDSPHNDLMNYLPRSNLATQPLGLTNHDSTSKFSSIDNVLLGQLLETIASYRRIGFGLLGIGLIMTLEKMRRRQMRNRSIGKTIRMPTGKAAQVEDNLRRSINRGLATRMDTALRLAGFLIRGEEMSVADVPYVERVRLARDGIEIVFDRSLVPLTPFCQGMHERSWLLPASTQDIAFDGIDHEPAPAPALVTLGMSTLGIDLINLEIYGSIELIGDNALAEGALRAMAVELAGAPWSEYYQLLLVGFGEELHRIAGVRVLGSISECIAELEQATSAEELHLRTSDFTNLASARLQDIGFCSAPTIVLCAHAQTQQEASRLADIARPLTSGLAVVFAGHVQGALHSLYLEDAERIENAANRSDDPSELACSLSQPSVMNNSLPLVVNESKNNTSYADITFSESLVQHLALSDVSTVSSQLEPTVMQALDCEQLSAIGELFDVVSDLDGPSNTKRTLRYEDTSSLDVPLWPDMQVAVMGPIEIRGKNGSIKSCSWGKPIELIVYLALHHSGADTDTWATALWPDKLVSPKTIANALYEARRILGTSLDGSPYLPRHCQRYTLQGVTTDWYHFQSLSSSDDPTQWRAALGTVRGRPFDGLKESTWTVMEGFVAAIEADICDLAIRYSEAMFASGLPGYSAWAARQALMVTPWDERLHRILMQAAYEMGNPRGVEEVMRRLMQILEDEVEPADILQPETLELYKQLTGTRYSPADAVKNSPGLY